VVDWRIERLERGHDRAGFSCGKPPLDQFIQRLVGQYEKRNLGRTYVAVRPGEMRVIGYYTLASGSIAFQKLPEPTARKLPRHPAPVILLARLAVDLSAQGRGLGAALLIDALSRCLTIADKVGVHEVEVDAIDERASDFYARFGFSPLPDDALHLFLPTATIRDALGGDQASASGG
jgi:GNAT superfamily N-acetyltransferase